MPTYAYTAMDANGKERHGRLDGKDENHIGAVLREQGLFPTTVSPAPPDGPQPPTRKRKRSRVAGSAMVLGTPRLGRKALTLFTRQLAILLRAGLPLVRALRTLEQQATDVSGRMVIAGVGDSVESGHTFSEALNDFPKTFDRLYVNMVRAGEASGAMEQVLSRVASYREKAERLRGRIKSALTYPVLVLTIALLITAGLLYFVVPRFTRMFEDLTAGRPLPLLTRIVVGASGVIRHQGLWVVAGLAVAAVLYTIIRRTRAGNYFFDYVLLKAPPFGTLLTKSSVARFAATLSTLMNAGVAVLNALQIVRDTAGNAVVSEAVQKIHDSVKEGESMSRPLRETRVFPGMVCSMIEVGEETGELPEMLSDISIVYEEEVDLAVDALTAMIEPIMIVGLGILIGSIVMAMFLPLFTIITDMTGGM